MLSHRLVVAFVCITSACASGPQASDVAPGDRPGPKRPLVPDHELDAATPVDIHDEPAMHAWLAERIARAHAGERERVRLPIVRRSASFGCDCPPYAIAPTADNGPFYWIAIVDLTGAGIPPGEWVGVVDGRFTAETRTYRSTDEGGLDILMPTFEVLRQRRRGPDEEPEARVVPDAR